MKIVDTDNFDRDYHADKVVAEGITSEILANVMCKALNDRAGPDSESFYRVVPDDYKLAPGFEA